MPNEHRLSVLDLHSLQRQSLQALPQVVLMRFAADAQRLLVGAQLAAGASLQMAWRNLAGNTAWQVVQGVDPNTVDQGTLGFDPSGRWLLWRNNNDGKLRLADLSSGVVSQIDLDVEAGTAPGFANRSAKAVIPAGGPSGHAVYLIDLQTAAAQWTDLGFGHFVGADFDSIDKHLVVLEGGGIWHSYRWPAVQLRESLNVNHAQRLQKLGTDEWAISNDYSEVTIVQPAGLFRLGALPLAFGNNVVAAIASAPGQLDSSPALPITVIVPADGLPDLAVRDIDISALPNVGTPGGTVRIAARIRNLGSTSSAPVTVRLWLTAPSGPVLAPLDASLASVPAAGERTLAWTTPALNAGVYSITVQVDPQRSLNESSIANNTATRLFTVNGDGRPELNLNAGPVLLGPTDLLNGSADVVNGAATFNGRVTVRVLDDADQLVASLRDEAVSLTAPGAIRAFAFQWAPSVRAGGYRIVAQLRDLTGQLIRQRDVQVEVRPQALLDVQLSPVQQSLTIGTTINVQARLRYVLGNYSIENSELRTRLVNANGVTVANDTRALPVMIEGFEADFAIGFVSQALVAGTYSVVTEVWQQTLLAEAGASVSLMQGAAPPQVGGQILLTSAPLLAGRAIEIPFEVRNSGAQTLVNLPVRASARRQLTDNPFATTNETWTLAPGESRLGVLSLPAANLTPGGLVLILNVPNGPLAGVLDYRAPLIVDGEPPLIVPVRPLANAIVKRDFQTEARVLDTHSLLDLVEARLGTGPYQAMAAGPNYAGQYAVRTVALVDGPTTLQVRARDAFGNVSVSAPWPVVVDSIAPLITVSGVTDGMGYAQAVTPIISVTDLHLDVVQISLNGATYNSGTQLSADGRYTLYISATDLAGNRATAVHVFTIDTRPPTLAFTFPAEGAVIALPTTPVRLATEAGISVQLSLGAMNWTAVAGASGVAEFNDVPLAEGVNLLRANAVDAVGNAAIQQTRNVIRSSVTVGIVGGSITAASAIGEPGNPIAGNSVLNNSGSIALTDIAARLSLLSATSGQTLSQQQWLASIAPGQGNPRLFEFATSGAPLGNYLLLLEAHLRGAGGVLVWTVLDQEPVVIADLTPPDLALITPLERALLPANFTVRATASDRIDQVERVDLILDNGSAIVMTPDAPGSYIASLSAISDGPHTLQVRASDRAGNLAQSPVLPRVIEVDGSPPQIQITGVVDNQLSALPLTPVITITDASTVSNVILLDGAPYVSGTPVSLEGIRNLSVRSTDAVGNVAQAQIRFTLDFTAPLISILSPASAVGVGDAHIPLLAQTEVGIDIDLLDQGNAATQVSNAAGQARFAAVPLRPGENILRVRARDRAGNVGLAASVQVFRFAVSQAPVTALVLMPTSVVHGQTLVGTAQLTSSVAANGLPDHIRIEVLRSDLSVIATISQTVALNLQQTLDLPFSFATGDWPAGMQTLRVSWRRGNATVPWSVLRTVPIEIRDVVAPDIVLLAPTVGATVPNPVTVSVRVNDALSSIGEVAARLDDGAWFVLQPSGVSTQWQAQLPAPELGVRLLSLRARDSVGNQRVLGPIPLCRSNVPSWTNFANGFEAQRTVLPPMGFEKAECGALPAAAKPWVEWLLGIDVDKSAQRARQQETHHAAH